MDIEFLEPAVEEFREAISFYNSQNFGLGHEFAEEVKKATDRILQYPEAWFQISRSVRRCPVNRFPFAVLYQMRKESLLIVGIMHLHREPDSWKDRLAGQ